MANLSKAKVQDLLESNTEKVVDLLEYINDGGNKGDILLARLDANKERLSRTSEKSQGALSEIYAFVKSSFGAIDKGCEAQIRDLVSRSHNSWLSGELAGQYNQTTVFLAVEAWLAIKKPADLKSWVNEGFTLFKGGLKAPWGFCGNHCGRALLPKWVEGKWRHFPICGPCNTQATNERERLDWKNIDLNKPTSGSVKGHAKKAVFVPSSEDLARVDTALIKNYQSMSEREQHFAKVKAAVRKHEEDAAARNKAAREQAKLARKNKPTESKKGQSPKSKVDGKKEKGNKNAPTPAAVTGSVSVKPTAKPKKK